MSVKHTFIASKNNIQNPGAEFGILGYNAYSDAAGVSPVDGSGGTPSVTITKTTSSPLTETGSFLITKDAVNRQGEGVSTNFLISDSEKAQVLSIEFDFSASANFVAGSDSTNSDLLVWIYDVTNAVLIQPTPYKITGLSGKFIGTFQSASNSNSYRLIWHVASTNANAWTFKFDNVSVSRRPAVYAPVVTDDLGLTYTYDGLGSPTNVKIESIRVGNKLRVFGALTAGTTTAVAGAIILPSGYNIDSSKLSSQTNAQVVGFMNHMDTATRSLAGQQGGPFSLFWDGSTTNKVFIAYDTNTSRQFNKSAINNAVSTSDSLTFWFEIPILGWSANLQINNDADTRVVAASYYVSSGSFTPGANTQFNYDTKVFDTHNAVTTGAGVWKFTAPISGYYDVATHTYNGSNNTSNISVYKNGSNFAYTGFLLSGSGNGVTGSVVIQLNAGEYIDVRGSSAGAYSGGSAPFTTHISIRRVTGPSAIAASEKIYLHYQNNGGTSLTAGVTNIDWTVKHADSHGAWSGSVFTAPRAGFYSCQGMFRLSSSLDAQVSVWKNGSNYLTCHDSDSANVFHKFAFSIYLLAGETMSIRQNQNATLTTGAGDSWISISSQG